MNLAQYNRKEMQKAKVYMYDKMAGILTEDENGFHFLYDQSYLKSKEPEPVSLTLPLTDKEFESKKIDAMVYELHGLREDKIKIIENN